MKDYYEDFQDLNRKLRNKAGYDPFDNLIELPKDIYISEDKYNSDMVIDKELKRQITELVKKEIGEISVNGKKRLLITDDVARQDVTDLLKFCKNQNKQKVDILELSSILKLPIDQVGRIMKQLIDEGILIEET